MALAPQSLPHSAPRLLETHGFLRKAAARIIAIFERDCEAVGGLEQDAAPRSGEAGPKSRAALLPAPKEVASGSRRLYSCGWETGGEVEVFTSGPVELGALARVSDSWLDLKRAELAAVVAKT